MPWYSLGQIEPSQTEWRFFEILDDLETRLFRVTHSYDLGGVSATLLIASHHPAYDAFFGIRKVYPDPRVQLLEYPVPVGLAPVARDIAIKATWRSRIYTQDNWRVSLDAWVPPAPTP
ncbi:hypothetical protein [Phormidium sp. FACHB-1136]|uniref:hypothetical protein n=1 Tax=Phormidium sp. FACHB-1136 TaxID=2692848 RepID=UPI001684EE7C|nr:hypothetical protein [Phormidium sp. FACHB-1136]MBD2425258.1 hypothetical protein [Phormidium sp. FACHB-1136]